MGNEQGLPTSFFAGLTIFSGVGDREISTLTEGYTIRHLTRGEVLFKQEERADFFILVLKGHLKILKSIQGRQTILTILSAGEIAAALLMTQEDSFYPGDLVALNVSTVALVPKGTYQKHWMTHPQMSQNVQRCVQHRLRDIQEDRSSQFLNTKGRLALFLLRYFTEDSKNKNADIKLTRLEISTAIGAEPETVIRTMKAFEREGLISIDHGKVSILKPLELADLAKSS